MARRNLTIEQMRAFFAALDRGEVRRLLPHAAEIVAAWREYELGACAGITMDQVLGLCPEPGGRAWWTRDRAAVRDGAVRELAAQGEDARGIVKLLDRQRRAATAPRDEKGRLARAVIDSGAAVPSLRTVQRIIGAAPRAARAHDAVFMARRSNHTSRS